MIRKTIPAAILLAVAAVAGCGSSRPSSAPASSSAATVGTPAATPSPSPTGPLTIHQAKHAYTAIVDPYNVLVDAANRDQMDGAPFAQYRRDVQAIIAGDRAFSRKVGQVRWPARVQPYIDAMRATDIPADIHCDRAEIRASSYGQAQVVDSTNSWCQQVSTGNSTNADQVRRLLHLPPVTG
jgi:hypothetical protein